ncbi:T-cell-specific surface glycoprotein CD28 [Lacerta agilis]|uniref:T-cell-specific surface glycoprotein CD28 n=1 Tax=Lacerta agilis TaxID=80427 RepID=UPI001419EE36|nr:T-cell-specific surface glycoprotein CD28 [Lacerta agilis]
MVSSPPFCTAILWVLTALSIMQPDSLTEANIVVQQRPLRLMSESAKIFCSYTSNGKKIKAFKASLRKGIERVEVCSIYWNNTHNIANNGTEISCQVAFRTEKEVSFSLQSLHANQTDIYSCKIDILDPPPYEFNESLGTLVHVKAPEAPESRCLERPEFMSMAAAIGVLIFYSILTTAAFFYCWLKTKKNKIVRNDYFNMTAWQANAPKKRSQPPGVPARNYTAYRSWEP